MSLIQNSNNHQKTTEDHDIPQVSACRADCVHTESVLCDELFPASGCKTTEEKLCSVGQVFYKVLYQIYSKLEGVA